MIGKGKTCDRLATERSGGGGVVRTGGSIRHACAARGDAIKNGAASGWLETVATCVVGLLLGSGRGGWRVALDERLPGGTDASRSDAGRVGLLGSHDIGGTGLRGRAGHAADFGGGEASRTGAGRYPASDRCTAAGARQRRAVSQIAAAVMVVLSWCCLAAAWARMTHADHERGKGATVPGVYDADGPDRQRQLERQRRERNDVSVSGYYVARGGG